MATLSLENENDDVLQQWTVDYSVGQSIINLLDMVDAHASESTLYFIDEFGDVVDEVFGINPVTLRTALDALLS